MAETVGQHSVAAFTSPVNGTSPIDANTVKGNDNTIRSAYVDHDADPGIHVQSSTLASRPVANSAGRKWMTQDSGVIRLFYDDGTNWYEVDYLRTTGGTISGNLSITGTLAVTGVATFTAQPILSSLTASRAVFTDGSKGLVSNAITGTGDVVMSSSPTLTGTITAASATLSGTLGVSGLLTFASLKGTGATTVTNILDEDNMASDSATALATQQSIKAYVDAQVGASDALSEVLAIGNTTGANDIIVNAGQKIRTPAVAAQDGSSAITIANTTGALTLATALADSNLATISTAGKVSNSATTATDANTASAIVARDASGNFTAGTITAALTGNASTATTLQTARSINGVSFNGSADITVTAAAGTLTGTTLASNVTASSLTSVGTLANLTVTNPITGSVTGSSGSTTGNAATATALQTARNINGVSFNGTADITVTAAAGTLTGTTLASGVTASSLTSVGTLSSMTVSGATTLASTSGDVAIGSTNVSKYSASYKTLILDGAAATAAIQINNTTTGSGTNSGGLLLAQAGNDSYIWNPKNSFISFGTNNGEKMRLDASGNLAVDTNTLYVDAANNRVGVGTASPDVTLDVEAAAGSSTALVMLKNTSGASANNIAQMQFWSGNTFGGLEQIASIHGINPNAGSNNGGTLVFSTSSNGTATTPTERMRLDASGNLGLGVTPNAGWVGARTLDIGTYTSVFQDADGYPGFAFNTYQGTSGTYRYKQNDRATRYSQYDGQHRWFTAPTGIAGNAITFTQAMTLDASGRLGVGTSSPVTKADVTVATAASLGSGDDGLRVANGTERVSLSITGSTYSYGGAGSSSAMLYSVNRLNLVADTNNPITFHTGSAPTEKMRLDASGNLGVGTTSPSSFGKAAIVAASNTTSFYTGTTTQGLYISTDDSTRMVLYASSGSLGGGHRWNVGNTEAARIDSSGNVGIGTTSILGRFTVAGGYSYVTDDGTRRLVMGPDGTGVLLGTSTNHYLRFITNDTERARITSGGEFLVNTTSGNGQLTAQSTTTDGTSFALGTKDSSGTSLFRVRGDGALYMGLAGNSPYNLTTGSAANAFLDSGGYLYRSTSSLKYKTDIEDATHGLTEVLALRPVTYKGINDGDTVFGGLIAEEVHEAGLSEFVVYDAEGQPDALHYGNMVSLLVRAIQEQQVMISSLEARLAALES